MRKDCYVYSWGLWFSMVHGWQCEPELERPYYRVVADIVLRAQPGVIVVEVSA